MNKLGLEFVLAIARHLFTAVAGVLVAKGVASADQAEAVSGGLLAALAIISSLLQKHEQQKALAAAHADARAWEGLHADAVAVIDKTQAYAQRVAATPLVEPLPPLTSDRDLLKS